MSPVLVVLGWAVLHLPGPGGSLPPDDPVAGHHYLQPTNPVGNLVEDVEDISDLFPVAVGVHPESESMFPAPPTPSGPPPVGELGPALLLLRPSRPLHIKSAFFTFVF